MTELYKIILTSSLTVAGGIIVFVLGQIVVKFVIEPLQEQAKLIGEIANSLVFFANVGANVEPYYYQKLKEVEALDEPIRKVLIERYEQILKNHWKKSDDASEILRQQASSLVGVTNSIPLYGFWSLLKRVPKYEDVLKASSELIGMANSTHGEHSLSDRTGKIAKLLNIKIIFKLFGNGKKLSENEGEPNKLLDANAKQRLS